MKEKRFTIKDLPASEQPYEKCYSGGTACLSDAELLAVVIRTGTKEERSVEVACHILQTAGSSLSDLGRISESALLKIKGIGRVKAIQILCVAELAKRMAASEKKIGLELFSPKAVADYYMPRMRYLDKEHVRLLMTDGKSRIVGEVLISIGTCNCSLISPRELFIPAVESKAVGVILLHNHPSGDPTPSKSDILVTKRVLEAGTLLGIELMDHIIIGDNRFISLMESGYMN